MVVKESESKELYDTIVYFRDKENRLHDCIDNYYDILGEEVYNAFLLKKPFSFRGDVIYVNEKEAKGIINANDCPIEKRNKERRRWVNYREKCRIETRKVDFSNFENSDKPRVAQFIDFKNKDDYYSIDHKISIYYGFKNNIPYTHIAHEDNLRIIKLSDNMLKGKRNFIDNKNKWILYG